MKLVRVMSLFLVVLVLSCGHSPGRHGAGHRKGSSGNHVDVLTVNGRDVCFLGSSDPCLPGREPVAWDQASRDAVKNLFHHYRPVEIRSGCVMINSNWGHNVADCLTINELKATLSGVRVVGWWRDVDGWGPRTVRLVSPRRDIVWSVACIEGYEKYADSLLPEAFQDKIPSWLKRQEFMESHYCSIGVSGPTWDPEVASRQAVDDARSRIAMTICTVADFAFVSYLDGNVWSFPDATSSTQAELYMAIAVSNNLEKVDIWSDVDGVGPLASRDVVYARVCVPRVKILCR